MAEKKNGQLEEFYYEFKKTSTAVVYLSVEGKA